MSELWRVIPEETQSRWLTLSDAEGEEGDVWYRADVRFDGCVHLYTYGNVPYNEDSKREDPACCDDYIHICSIDDMIVRLQALKVKAKEHFGDDWR